MRPGLLQGDGRWRVAVREVREVSAASGTAAFLALGRTVKRIYVTGGYDWSDKDAMRWMILTVVGRTPLDEVTLIYSSPKGVASMASELANELGMRQAKQSVRQSAYHGKPDVCLALQSRFTRDNQHSIADAMLAQIPVLYPDDEA